VSGRGVVGVALGVGAGAVALLLYSRRASAMTPSGSPRERPSVPPSLEAPRVPPSPEAPRGTFPPLVERWRGEVAKRAKDLPVDAILEWIRIESGGDMCSPGIPGREAGIFQLDFPDDAKYGASFADLMAVCQKSKGRANPSDILWLSEHDLDMQVGAGIRKILAARDVVRRVFAQNGVAWPETSFDFGSAVKQIHATPGVITELVPKITKRDGHAPLSWADLRERVRAFPIAQMGTGLHDLALAKSKHGLPNRLDDTMYNAEFVGRAWASARGSYV